MKHLKNSILVFLILILLSPICCSITTASNVESMIYSDATDVKEVAKVDVNLSDVSTHSPSSLLLDVKTGEILYAKNAYKKMYPASTTKLMTAILTLENCNLNDIVTVSHNAIFSIPVGYSHANLMENEQLTVEQLLNVLLIPSANDAAIALAEHISGSVENFSAMMNNKAKELGCINTNFVNPNGIHEKNHYSCAYDLALIGKYAMKFPDILRIAKVGQYTLPKTNKYNKTDRIFNLTNALMSSGDSNYYEYATGLKTGYTDTAGSCIVATAKKDDRDLLVVILGSDSVDGRYNDCKKLFNYGFEQYSYVTLKKTEDVAETIKVENATRETKNLDLYVKEDFSILLKTGYNVSQLEPVIEINPNLKAPISENQVVGKITYTVDSKTYSADLIAGADVLSSSFESFLFKALLIFLILYILYTLLKLTGNSTPRKKSSAKKKIVKASKKKGKATKKNASNFMHQGRGQFKFTQINDYL